MHSARFLDPTWHRDPRHFELAKERIFARAWHLLDPRALPSSTEPDLAQPCALVPGLLDEPLLALREPGGGLRLLSNVCTHRAAILCDAPTRGPRLRCPYHGRVFDLAGRALSAPGFPADEFPQESDHLSSVAAHGEGELWFASLDPREAARDWLAPVLERVSRSYLDRLRPDSEHHARYELEAGWLLYLENYLEGLHIAFVHPGLRAALDPSDYKVELTSGGVVQVGYARDGDPCFEPTGEHPEAGRRVAAWYVYLFPSTLLNFYPWGLSANVVTPLAPKRTRVDYYRWIADAALLERGAGSGLDRVELEDQAVVERVQRGIDARLHRGGHAAPRLEDGVLHLRHLIEQALG